MMGSLRFLDYLIFLLTGLAVWTWAQCAAAETLAPVSAYGSENTDHSSRQKKEIEDDDAASCFSCGGIDDPLVSSLLESLVISLPDVCETETSSNASQTVCLSQITCGGVRLDAVPSQYLFPSTLVAGVTGLSMRCSGLVEFNPDKADDSIRHTGAADVHEKNDRIRGEKKTEEMAGPLGLPSKPLKPTRQGFEALINNTALQAALFVEQSTAESGAASAGQNTEAPLIIYPQALAVQNCSLDSMDVSVRLAGRSMAAVSAAVERLMRYAVEKLVCDLGASFVAVNGSQWVQDSLDPLLSTIVSSVADSVPPHSARFVAWPSSPLGSVHSLLDALRLRWDGALVGCAWQAATAQLWNPFGAGTETQSESEYDRVDSATLRRWVGSFSQPARDTLLSSESGEPQPPALSTLPLHSFLFQSLPNVSLSLLGLRVDGLDTLSGLRLLEPLPPPQSNVTLRSEAHFERLDLQLDLEITIGKAAAEYAENITLHVSITQVGLQLDLLVAADALLLANTYLDQLGTKDGGGHALGCWLHVLEELSVPNLALGLSLNTVELVQISGAAGPVSADLMLLLNNALRLPVEGFHELTDAVLSGALQGPLRAGANAALAGGLQSLKEQFPCLSHYPHGGAGTEPDYAVWRNSSAVAAIDWLVNEVVGAAGLNTAVRCITGGSGSVTFEDALGFGRAAVTLGGLDTWSVLSLLAPWPSRSGSAKDFDLASYVALGECAEADSSLSGEAAGAAPAADVAAAVAQSRLVAGLPAEQSCPLAITLSRSSTSAARETNEQQQLQRQIQSTSLLSAAVMDWLPVPLRLTLRAVGQALGAVPLRSDVTHGTNGVGAAERALVGGAEAVAEATVTLSVAQLHIYMDLVLQVDRNTLSDLQEGQLDTTGCLASAVQRLAVSAVYANTSHSAVRIVHQDGSVRTFDVTKLANGVLGALLSANRVAESNADRAQQLAVAGDICANDGVDPNAAAEASGGSGGAAQWTSAGASLIVFPVALVSVTMAGIYTYLKKDSIFMRLFGSDPGVDVWVRWDCRHALVFDRALPLWLRVAVPPLLVAVFVIFVFCDYYDVANMVVQVVGPQQTSDKVDIFHFGLAGTVNDLWEAEVYALACLISFFSGFWPFLKLFLMLVSWVTPPFFLSAARRGQLLHFLDAVGKWSLLDVFVMLLFVSAFYCEFDLGEDIQVFVAINPTLGFYGFLAATMSSLLLGHCMYFSHNVVLSAAKPGKFDADSDCSAGSFGVGEAGGTQRGDGLSWSEFLRGSQQESKQRLECTPGWSSCQRHSPGAHEPVLACLGGRGRERLESRESRAGLDGAEYSASPLGAVITVPVCTPVVQARGSADHKGAQSDGEGEGYHPDQLAVDMSEGDAEPPQQQQQQRRRSSSEVDLSSVAISDDQRGGDGQRHWSLDSSSVGGGGGAKAVHGCFGWLYAYLHTFDSDESDPVCLCRAVFKVDDFKRRSATVQITALGQALVVLGWLGILGLLFASVYFRTMRFTFLGLVGALLQDDAAQEYSVITIGTLFVPHARMGNDPGIWWTAVMYFLFCVVSPLAVVCFAAALWVVPLRRPSQRALLAVGEVTNAWSALEVFVVAVLASLLQVQQFAAFIVGDSCDGINKILRQYADKRLDGDDKCLDVIAELTGDFWYLLAAAVVLLWASLSTFHLTIKMLRRELPGQRVMGTSVSSCGGGNSGQGSSLLLPLLSDISDTDTLSTDGSTPIICKWYGAVVIVLLRVLDKAQLVKLTEPEPPENKNSLVS